ncbi:hypothetical protein AB1K70_06010 [Bremerella sp. JC770]|uniref:hypothetical protein n=1 Tax=Bremerella sp. JC770 TaxID=3232137 RepID=UPI00345949BF
MGHGLPTEKYPPGLSVGNVFHCEGGTVADGNFYPNDSDKVIRVGADAQGLEVVRHMQNFIDAVRSRKAEQLTAEVMEGHYSSALAHLSNISYRQGESVDFESAVSMLGRNGVATDTVQSLQSHLQDNSAALPGADCIVGRELEIDVANETILNDSESSGMLLGEYH